MQNRKVLIITYYWPPSAGSGVQRWLKFTKYLPLNGWEPIVYTPSNPSFDIVDQGLNQEIGKDVRVIKKKILEPYSLVNLLGKKSKMNTGLVSTKKKGFKSRALDYIRGNYFIPDPRRFWIRPSVKRLSKLIKEENIEIVITTGPPHSMHLIGLGLKRKLKIKWIADFRDPFSKLDFLDTYNISKKNRQKYYQLETDILNNADRVMATSYSMHEMLMPFDQKKFVTITNGYDEDDFVDRKSGSTENKIVLYHAGLLNQVRNPVNLWKAIKRLVEENPPLKETFSIHLAGIIDQGIIEFLQNDSILKSMIQIEGYKKHEEVINDYFNSDILLLLINNSDNNRVNIPGKLFEYLRVDKPILALGNPHADAVKILRKSDQNRFSAYEDEESVYSGLKFLIENHSSTNNPQSWTEFSRRSLTKDLSDLLSNCLSDQSQ